MEHREEVNMIVEGAKREGRVGQLLQVWRDYYDEIFEVDLSSGTYDSLMDTHKGVWSKNGFVEIDVILLSEKYVHPDDKEAFKEFFDFEKIKKCIEEEIFVTKLNFRMMSTSGEYVWIKVKNIVPTKQSDDRNMFFACFRKVDNETGSDMRYKQELSDALASARALNERRNVLLNRVFREIKSPLNGIIGMAGLLCNDVKENNLSQEKLLDRIEKLEEQALVMNRALNQLMSSNVVEKDEKAGVQFVDHPVNKISYSRKKQPIVDTTAKNQVEPPKGYAYLTEMDTTGAKDEKEREFDFRGRRFLVVEDNELNLEVMKEVLESTGAVVDTAVDGKSAVISFVSRPAGTYDVILMDIDIPVIDGYSATRCIRISGKDDSNLVPIFAVTSNNFDEEVRKTYEYGFNAFFVKPVDFGLLMERIEQEIGHCE